MRKSIRLLIVICILMLFINSCNGKKSFTNDPLVSSNESEPENNANASDLGASSGFNRPEIGNSIEPSLQNLLDDLKSKIEDVKGFVNVYSSDLLAIEDAINCYCSTKSYDKWYVARNNESDQIIIGVVQAALGGERYNIEDVFSDEIANKIKYLFNNDLLVNLEYYNNNRAVYTAWRSGPAKYIGSIYITRLNQDTFSLLSEMAIVFGVDQWEMTSFEQPILVKDDFYIYQEVFFMP